MAFQTNYTNTAGTNLEDELTALIPGYIIDSNPQLVAQIRDEILNNYVVLDREGLVATPTPSQSPAAYLFPAVKRGDLITAQLINSIIAAVMNLDQRIRTLEGAGPGHAPEGPVITGFSFPGQQLRVDDRLTVMGRNFLSPATSNIVTIGGVPVTDFALSSNTTQLIFIVPEISGVTANGSSVPVVVSNIYGTDTSPVTLFPAVSIPAGRIEVVYAFAPVMPEEQPNIIAGDYVFTFSMTTFVDLNATYTMTPVITGNGNWNAVLLEDDGNQTRANNQISIPGDVTGIQRDVRIRVTVPSGQINGTVGVLNLGVTETTDGSNVTPGNTLISIAIGSPPPTPETRARVTLSFANLAAQISGNGVQFTNDGAIGQIQFNILFTLGGNYTVNAAFRTAAGWSEPQIDMPSFAVSQPEPGESTNQNINVLTSASSTATATDLFFVVSRLTEAGATDFTVQYVLGLTVAE